MKENFQFLTFLTLNSLCTLENLPLLTFWVTFIIGDGSGLSLRAVCYRWLLQKERCIVLQELKTMNFSVCLVW